MEFETYYSSFDQISVLDDKEKLFAKFYGPQYFRTEKDESFGFDVQIDIEKQIPPQMDPEMGKNLGKAAAALSGGSKAVVIA